MKKIFLLLTIFSMVFTSCEPLEDINAEVDAKDNPIVGDAIYTLTDDDYDALDLSNGRFNSLDDAKAALPAFLADKYPVWGKGSSALIGFNQNVGYAFSVKNYTLDLDDYATSGSTLLGFESTATPVDYLTDIITSEYDEANEGDYVSAYYDQYTGGAFTVTPTVSLDENLDYGTVAGDLTTVSSDSWVSHSGAGDGPVTYIAAGLSMDGYPSTDLGGAMTLGTGSEDVNREFTTISTGKVYASALVNLSAVSDGNYFFHMMEASSTLPYAQFRARVGAKDDGSGKISFGIGASSSTLTYGTNSYELNTTYLLVSSYEIETGISNLYILTAIEATEPLEAEATNTGSAGNAISAIAVRQSGGVPTVTIDGVRVANTWSSIMSNEDLEDEVVGNKETYNAIYTYAEGAWVLPSGNGYYAVTDADFASIGIESFGSSAYPDDYLSTFLGLKFPYSKNDDVLNVVYKYVSSSSGEQVRGNKYTKTDGVWVGHESTIDTSFQFGHDGSVWAPDNTIKYTLIRNADYEYMASQLKDIEEYAGLTGNLGSYGDFDYNWDKDEQIPYALIIFLNHHDPDAAEGQKYTLTYVIYDNGENEYQSNFIKEGGVWIENK